jgi:hypothetical protein
MFSVGCDGYYRLRYVKLSEIQNEGKNILREE